MRRFSLLPRSPEKALVLLSSLSSASRQECRSSWHQRPRGEAHVVSLTQALLLNVARRPHMSPEAAWREQKRTQGCDNRGAPEGFREEAPATALRPAARSPKQGQSQGDCGSGWRRTAGRSPQGDCGKGRQRQRADPPMTAL
uniref:Uncharacterized protein n=1 Tax=Rangifer tarandus platyrhynchus TaxID=3082113 RepID=A0ACB0FG91_RANTA|nr:unnamed protein product [Rangifer tarandus platyrhynchus]